MTRHCGFAAGIAVVLLVVGAQGIGTRVAAAQSVEVVGDYALSDVGVGRIVNDVLRGAIDNDRRIQLGGFSDLCREGNALYIITDRGPNATVTVGDEKRRTFPVPGFTPLILSVRIDGDRLTLTEANPLVGRSNKAVTGLPNRSKLYEEGYDFEGRQKIADNPSGLDPEGFAIAADGNYWLAEEYLPSLAKVEANGRVLKRFVPAGIKLPGADYEVADTLPAVYSRRQDNRGFEGLALSPDGKTLYAAIQSPLANPSKKVAEASRNTRVLAFDVVGERPAAEYVYQFDIASDFAKGAKPDDMKIGALAMVSPERMLVLERDDDVAKIYSVEFKGATNLLGTPQHAANGAQSLERIDNLQAKGIQPLKKTLVADLSKIRSVPGKLEGLAIVDPQTLAIVNDNDFGFAGFDPRGNAISNGVKSRLLLIRLPKPLE